MKQWEIDQERTFVEEDSTLRPRLAALLEAEASRPQLSGLDERVYAAFAAAGVEKREAIVTDTRRGGRRWESLPEGAHITGRQPHETVELRSIPIDADIAPLVQACWALGIDTGGSCQGDDAQARAWLLFPSMDHAARFLAAIGAADARPAMLAAALETMTPGPLSPLQAEDRFWFYVLPGYEHLQVGISFDPSEIPDLSALLLGQALPEPAASIER